MRNLTGQEPRRSSNRGNLLPRSSFSDSTAESSAGSTLPTFESNSSSDRPGRDNRFLPYPGSRYPEICSSGTNSLVNTPRTQSLDGSTLGARSSDSSQFSRVEEKSAFIADESPFGGYPIGAFPITMEEKEADDHLHNPDPFAEAKGRSCSRPDRRNVASICAFLMLIAGAICVFIVLPALTFTGVIEHDQPLHGGDSSGSSSNVSEALSPYKYPMLSAIRTSLIDVDTPQEAMTFKSRNGSEWELVFSDEFEVEGRSFYEGDDQFWTAMDFHYQATQDLEWYDPDAATTKDGVLQLRMDAYRNHNLNYRSGMVQSWNKLCFTQGYIEVGARMPGNGSVPGMWPGLWTLGNLARPGYLATSEGLWPYSYNACDIGITPNQSSVDGLSYLEGQRLPSCTCKNADHPNPGVGRGAPEIDIIEGTVQSGAGLEAFGQVSQSLQVAPMDIWYMVDYDYIEIYNSSITVMNSWTGGPLQQAVSGVTNLNNDWYELSESRSFQTYGFEYMHDPVNGYISWYVGSDPVYTMYAPALSANGNVDQRLISREPMSIVMNLGLSTSWTYISWLDLTFPVTFEIDYVRIYQPKGETSVTCDPKDFPTKQYIEDHINAYTNQNLTSWADAGYARPLNTFMDGCS